MPLEWDTRLYTVAPVVELLHRGTTIASEAARSVVDAATHTATVTLVLAKPLAPGRVYVLSAGRLAPTRDPDDLIADLVPLVVNVSEPDEQGTTVTVLSRPGDANSSP